MVSTKGFTVTFLKNLVQNHGQDQQVFELDYVYENFVGLPEILESVESSLRFASSELLGVITLQITVGIGHAE